MDRLTPEQRRRNMQAIRSRDTKMEVRIRKALWHKGFRYRKNDKSILGKPDISFKSSKVVVFCDSDFWHGRDIKSLEKRLDTNKSYWLEKIRRNIIRDSFVTSQLEKNGWLVLRFWETEIKKNIDECLLSITKAVIRRKN